MNNEQIDLVKLTGTDLDELRDISISTFYESFIWYNTEENMQLYIGNFLSHKNLYEDLTNPDSAFYFAKMEGKVIGYIKLNWGKAQTDLKDSNGLEIERIYIIKEFRGKNIGQILFNKALQLTHENDFDHLWLGVWEKNTGAIKFYERNGMVKFGTHPFMLGEDLQTDHLMKFEV